MAKKAIKRPVRKAIGDQSLPQRVRDLEHDNAELRRRLEFQNNSIALLNVINTNMRAALRTSETYFVILTGVTADTGLKFNRAMLFIRPPVLPGMPRDLQGVLAISPNDKRSMKRFYEEARDKKFDFSFYVEQYYNQNLKVDNKLHECVRKLLISGDQPNILMQCLRDRRVQVYPKALKKDFRGAEPLRRILTKEFVVAPVVTRDEEIGVIVADNFYNDRPIGPEDVAALQTLAEFAASIIVSARKYEEAEELAIVDELTKIYNYRFFERRMEEETGRGRRYNRVFSVLLFDIDFFKNFNDRNGHLTGNKALMDLAGIIRGALRAVDVPARYGGEEFAVILPETAKEGAAKVAEKILNRVRAHHFLGGENQPSGRLTISGGVAAFPEDGDDAADIMARADTFLYRAKANGKDQFLG